MPASEGLYRLQSFLPAGGSEYITVMPTGQVKGAPRDESSDKQKWKVVQHPDDNYGLVNASTGFPMRVVAPHDTEEGYTVYADGSGNTEPWNLNSELKGNVTMILCTGKYAPKALDVSAENRVVLWERNEHPNQHWVLESVKPKDPVRWVTVPNSASIPANAVVGGHTGDGRPLLVARAWITEANVFYPGKACASIADGCWIGYGGVECTIRTHFDVLGGDAYQWVDYPSGGWLDVSKLAGTPIEGCGDATNGSIYSSQGLMPRNELSCGQAGAGPIFTANPVGIGAALLSASGTQVLCPGAYKVLCSA